jgi:ferredoxin
MRVAVDADRCEGHARCWGICPEVFDLDDEGHAIVVLDGDVPIDLEAKVADAVRNCPERAITVT